MIDGVEALDPPLDFSFDVVFAELLDERVFDALQELLALDAAGFDGGGDLFVADGVGIAEGEVFELAADFTHAEAVRQWGVDVESLAGNGFLTVGLQVLEGAHVVQAIGELDEHDADVGNHGQQHFSDVFCLTVFAIGELNFVDLGDALYDVGDLVAEAGFNFLAGRGRVFDGVMEQACGDGGRVHLHFGEDFGYFEGMNNVRLARGAHLALVVLDAEVPGFADEADVVIGAIGLDMAKEGFKARVDGMGICGLRRTRSVQACRAGFAVLAGVGNIGL